MHKTKESLHTIDEVACEGSCYCPACGRDLWFCDGPPCDACSGGQAELIELDLVMDQVA